MQNNRRNSRKRNSRRISIKNSKKKSKGLKYAVVKIFNENIKFNVKQINKYVTDFKAIINNKPFAFQVDIRKKKIFSGKTVLGKIKIDSAKRSSMKGGDSQYKNLFLNIPLGKSRKELEKYTKNEVIQFLEKLEGKSRSKRSKSKKESSTWKWLSVAGCLIAICVTVCLKLYFEGQHQQAVDMIETQPVRNEIFQNEVALIKQTQLKEYFELGIKGIVQISLLHLCSKMSWACSLLGIYYGERIINAIKKV